MAAAVLVATLFFFIGFHYGSRRGALSCVLEEINKGSMVDGRNVLSTSSITVYVVGAVKRPGVYTIAGGSRVVDAINAAGGFTASANQIAVNLAMKVVDGMKIYVPFVRSEGQVVYGDGSSGSFSSGKIPINTATEKELETIPGIGPVLASRIVEYRREHGPFASYEDLLNVKGIGEKILEKIKPYIEVP